MQHFLNRLCIPHPLSSRHPFIQDGVELLLVKNIPGNASAQAIILQQGKCNGPKVCLQIDLTSQFHTQFIILISDIDSREEQSREFVQSQRKEQFELLKQALVTINKINELTSLPELFMYMHFLEEGVLPSEMETHVCSLYIFVASSVAWFYTSLIFYN